MLTEDTLRILDNAGMFGRVEIVRNGKHAQMPRMRDIQRQQRMIDAAQFRAADDDERQPPRRKIIEERRRAGQWNVESARAFKQDEFVLFFQLPRRKGNAVKINYAAFCAGGEMRRRRKREHVGTSYALPVGISQINAHDPPVQQNVFGHARTAGLNKLLRDDRMPGGAQMPSEQAGDEGFPDARIYARDRYRRHKQKIG